jgi:hypothetical protein
LGQNAIKERIKTEAVVLCQLFPVGVDIPARLRVSSS